MLKCREGCQVTMVPGIAFLERMGGTPDFAGDDYVCTISPMGESDLVNVLKCPQCGHSVKPTGDIKETE